MPICTTCTRWTPHLHTVYESAYNLRLEQCSNCHAFADPYIEHDDLTLLIDLILLKRGVYRHLLFNQGAKPRRATETSSKDDNGGEEKSRWLLIVRLGGALTFVDAFIRWTHLNPSQSAHLSPWSGNTIANFTRTFIGCFAETVAFHCGVIAACSVVLKMITSVGKWRQRHPSSPESDIRREFRQPVMLVFSYLLIPLTLFYSSLIKLFLLFLLTIWRPSRSEPLNQTNPWDASKLSNFLNVLDNSQLDREWIVRNVLGGMSAGFGLRVILDCHPVFTMLVILCGWVTKTVMAALVSKWVGGDDTSGEAWLAYSIP
ncbi:Arv1-like family-domain-containing protein [Desarmillaria tabescens]|uniref:Protein ARV n=1 Tax=Armillaria tabescens TaxID=1929756 RepID=A0AA39NR10_ARMTA|nr:Arv1-like family-domain-containing protein [Desarmillaria tabescens]KAK0470272.1 Arv1-like family-domain-containing protein [Desarmillaria tabescens]